jgi:hypothetical protein
MSKQKKDKQATPAPIHWRTDYENMPDEGDLLAWRQRPNEEPGAVVLSRYYRTVYTDGTTPEEARENAEGRHGEGWSYGAPFLAPDGSGNYNVPCSFWYDEASYALDGERGGPGDSFTHPDHILFWAVITAPEGASCTE